MTFEVTAQAFGGQAIADIPLMVLKPMTTPAPTMATAATTNGTPHDTDRPLLSTDCSAGNTGNTSHKISVT
jgi:hypothetical protein